ncbi:MAG TPA: aminotransferase class V-fold PLP-dependent enzyme [Pseudomonadales bacterium]|nr:aminotransferase class V-fold PLP-dependent enzyme [Pseudomonadales bacterium]
MRHGALVHCDAVQALSKIPVNFGLLGADLLTVSAHKLGGPLGCGALISLFSLGCSLGGGGGGGGGGGVSGRMVILLTCFCCTGPLLPSPCNR